jgi:peptidoglycan/LPS O-acetylase OafA/YrhL
VIIDRSATATPPVLLKDSLQRYENNNFNLIRLTAALLVLMTHSFESTTDPISFISGSFISGAYLGVSTFFFLSGLLVTQSLRQTPSWKSFLWRRFLRIYPAACLVILFCAFVVGPLATTLDLKDYFSHPGFYEFLSDCFLFHIHFTLPGLWERANGSISPVSPFWSIALELKLYLGLLLIWLLKIPGKKLLAFAYFIIAFLFNLFFYARTRMIFAKIIPIQFNPFSYTVLTPLFLAGVLCNLYKDKIRIAGYWIWILLVLLLICTCFRWLTLTTFILIPAFILYLATHGTRWMKKITPRADLSYGIYIWGGLAGRIVEVYIRPVSNLTNFLWTLLLVIPLATLSWYGLEKRMLSLKDRVQ